MLDDGMLKRTMDKQKRETQEKKARTRMSESFLNLNFDEVSDQFTSLEPGLYEVEITAAELASNRAKTGTNLVVEHSVVGDTPMAGRKIRNYMATAHPMGQTTIKRLCLSAGVTPGQGFDVSELIGKVAKVTVVSEPYTDPTTQEEKTSAKIKDYVLPA